MGGRERLERSLESQPERVNVLRGGSPWAMGTSPHVPISGERQAAGLRGVGSVPALLLRRETGSAVCFRGHRVDVRGHGRAASTELPEPAPKKHARV